MNTSWGKFYANNKAIVWAAVIALIITAGILLKVKDEVTRFTLIMPIFAGFILFSILVTADEDLEDEQEKEKPAPLPEKKEEKAHRVTHAKSKAKPKKSSKR